MAVQGWCQGKGEKGLSGPQWSETSLVARVCAPFCIRLSPSGEEPAEIRNSQRAAERRLPLGAFIARSPRGWPSALPSSPQRWEPSSPLPSWAFPSTDAQCWWPRVHMDTLLAKEDGSGEVSNCAPFLEGLLSKKYAEKWFGKWFGWEVLLFAD